MPDYDPTAWVNQTGPKLNATNLNKIENAIDAVEQAQRQGSAKEARVATTINITLSGTQTVDDVVLAVGNRVLVKNQTTASQNGLYLVSLGSWTRADDADDGLELQGGTLISVTEGTANGGGLFVCTNNTAVTVGTTALTFGRIRPDTSGLYTTDGTTPLKYSAFLSAALGNHQNAFQNAITFLYGTSGTYNKHLDLEGATVLLTQPVTAPVTGGSAGTLSITNGEIQAQSNFTGGDHMISIQGTVPAHFLRLVNVTMNGQTYASWIKWDKGNMVIEACQFKSPKPGTDSATASARAGLFCSDGGAGSNADAGFWINNCWFSTEQGAVEPTSRWTVGILSMTGDNKIGGGTTMSYFRHSAIFQAPGIIIHGFHPFQGKTPVGAGMTTHTASLKFTNGRCGAEVSGLYLGKSFMEISNETNTTQRDIGEIAITNMRAFMDNGEVDAAHIVVRDYSGLADAAAIVTDITLTNSKFINGGATQTKATKLFNPAAFNKQGCRGITMQGNTFETSSAGTVLDVAPQANPCTLRKTLASGTSHVIDFDGYFPFGGRVRSLVNAVGKNTSGGVQAFGEGAITTAGTIDVTTATAWAGEIIATATANNASSVNGFING